MLASSGCFPVAAGAGAGAAVAYNDRGATAQLPLSVDAAFDDFAKRVLEEMAK